MLSQHGVAHLVHTRVRAYEMVVPEQDHAFHLRRGRFDHLPDPPNTQL